MNKTHTKIVSIGLAAIVTVNAITNLAWLHKTRQLETECKEKTDKQMRELDKFYFGFCLEAKEKGYATLESYEYLCGDT